MMNFDSSVYVSEQLNRQMVIAAQELAVRAVTACGDKYGFSADEALRMLDIVNAKVSHVKRIEVVSKKEKVVVAKAAFPMPYNGEFNDACCYALRQNNGLYTQCQGVKGKNVDFCKQCHVLADKTAGVPEYGTIQMRQAVGIFEYTDPNGRKPVAYTKVMKKYKIDQEKVLEEAGKFSIMINPEHFVVAEVNSKRGRPSSQKEPKEPKGSKGRPKKAKKVLQIEGEGDDDDLFASLVADANNNSGNEAVLSTYGKKNEKSEEEKETERVAKESEKEAKKLALETAKANAQQEKEQKKQLEDEARAAKKKSEEEARAAKKHLEDEARAAKKQLEDEARAAKKLALEVAKKEKEEKIAAEKATKTKKADVTKVAEQQEDEPDVVKKIEFEGKKYLKSKKSGVIYDYNEYVKNGEQVMVGKWNESKNNIEFAKSTEEEQEEEYDM